MTLMLTATTMAAERAIIVLDGSGSMWGQIEGVPKLEIARNALRDVLENAPAGLELGLMAYGHREKGNCADIELLVPPRANSSPDIIAAADNMKFLGKTPISAAVRQAADALRFTEDKATVILITDGIETCEADPCAIAAELEERGMDFTAHVVGFGLSEEEGKQVSCLAETTGGRYLPAGNAAELKEALAHVQSVMDLQPMVQAQAEPEPEPAVEAEVKLDGPDQVVAGANFNFTWSGSINGRDMITIVPAGADEGATDSYIRAENGTSGHLTAPGTPGLYELRYVLNADKSTLASLSLEVVEAGVTLSGPDQVVAGANFDFTWSGSINGRDMITIVPAGADEGALDSYIRAENRTSGHLTASGTPGLYELRYVLNADKSTLASLSLEVVEAGVTLSGPDQVVAGANFDFTWSGSINGRDMITIVPAGADEGALDSYIRAENRTKSHLTAPGVPGLYELRYVLNADKSTLASLPLEIVEAEMGISGPATVRVGENVDITWPGEINPRDMVVIVPAGADANITAGYIRTDGRSEARMKAPDTAGLYEIRYILNKGGRVLASAPLEVVAADAPLDDGAGLDVPATARPGDVITVSWTGGSDSADQRISLAGADQLDFSWIATHKVGADKTLQLTMPEEAGTYEVRYLDISGRKVLGRAIVEVK
ncbi:MAG: VWA domain-containing protein [Pseudaminobacter sp.]